MIVRGRIAQLDEPGAPFDLREVELSDLRAGETLVRVRQVNVCGTDLHAWRGRFRLGAIGGGGPVVLGHELVGEFVTAEGPAFDDAGKAFEPGDRVVFPYFSSCHTCRHCVHGRTYACSRLRMAMLGDPTRPPYFVGGFADYFVVPSGTALYRVPDAVSDAAACGANCALAQVIEGLERVRVGLGDVVVVQGAGGLGLYATAVARSMGAARVIVVDALEDRLDMARQFGADATIWVDPEGTTKQRVSRVRELSDGYGADVVVEVVGSPHVIAEGIGMLASGGRYLEIGNINTGVTFEADASRIALGNKSIVGASLYAPSALGKALAFLESEGGRLPLDAIGATTFPLDEIDEAFRAASEREVLRASIVPLRAQE